MIRSLEVPAVEKKNKVKHYRRRFYRKRVGLFLLLEKIKLWPSRKGLLHGIKSIEKFGDQACITTHCNKSFMVNHSRNSRAARCLRNKLVKDVCPACGVPQWKLVKYSSTRFSRHHGSTLDPNDQSSHLAMN